MDNLEEDYDFLELLHVALEYKKPPEFNIGSLNSLLLNERGIREGGILLCKPCNMSLLAKGITRLHNPPSTNPKDPQNFHRNTCGHEMKVFIGRHPTYPVCSVSFLLGPAGTRINV
jgi:hypothetical protein